MSTTRKQIRQEVKARLEAAGIVAAGRVFTNRPTPAFYRQAADQSELPCITIFTSGETITFDGSEASATWIYKRDVRVAVEYLAAKGTAVLDDEIDDKAQLIEAVLDNDPSLGGKCQYFFQRQVEFDEQEDGEKTVAAVRLTYSAIYHQEVLPDVPAPGIAEFDKAHIDYDLVAGGEPVDATDDVTVP